MACQCLTSFASSVLRAPSWQRRRRFFQTDARCLMMALLPGDGEKSSFGRKMVARLTSIGKGEREREGERGQHWAFFSFFPCSSSPPLPREGEVPVFVLLSDASLVGFISLYAPLPLILRPRSPVLLSVKIYCALSLRFSFHVLCRFIVLFFFFFVLLARCVSRYKSRFELRYVAVAVAK